MNILTGKSVCSGVAIGKIAFFNRVETKIEKTKIENADKEIENFKNAVNVANTELISLYEKALKDVGEEHAMIFEVHQMMLADLDYLETIENMIKDDSINAIYAIDCVATQFAEMFASMEDEYMQGRAADVKDISVRVINILANNKACKNEWDEPIILISDDLAPSETVQLDKSKVLAFATEVGSSSSHTAILARTMNIPAIVNIGKKVNKSLDGKMAIVDGLTGEFIIEPDEETLTKLKAKQDVETKKKEELQVLIGQESITKDGTKIDVFANIGSPEDMERVLNNDAEGIGLFRSEFLYLENSTYPTEEEQFIAYKTVAEKMNGKKVVIRTLDIGADKQIGYFNLDKEENPALGYRAIRICLTRPEIFRTQMRALLRASSFGKIAVMFPMIISLEEVLEIKGIINKIKEELRNENISFDENMELGIMIETPAAALISDILAKEVDFFSVGTNDLTQYTLAIDRQNQTLERFYNAHHTAILRLIKMAADNAHAEGKWIGICGELGADTDLTEEFIKMGIDELSVTPPAVLKVRKKVREIDLNKN